MSKDDPRLMVCYQNRKGNGNLLKDPNSLRDRLEKKKGRPYPENLDEEDGHLEEGGTLSEAAVADLGSVSGGALEFLDTVAIEYDVEK